MDCCERIFPISSRFLPENPHFLADFFSSPGKTGLYAEDIEYRIEQE